MSTDANAIWNECLSFIKDNIQPQAFKTWFEPIKPVKLADNSLSVQVPSKFFYEWLEEHYVKLLKVALTKSLGEGAKLVYIIRMENTYGNREPFTEKIPSSNRSYHAPQEIDVPILIIFFLLFLSPSLMADENIIEGLLIIGIEQSVDDEEAPFDIIARNKMHKCGGKTSNRFRVHSEHETVAMRRFLLAMAALKNNWALVVSSNGCEGSTLVINRIGLHR